MTDHYPYDPGAFERTWRRLLELVPDYYRALDQGAGGADLERLVRALAAPLAVVRQSVDELHADLFVDSARDAVIPLLAEMVGTQLVFPDASSNRRDVRGTVARRKRKGTVQTLEELGADLSARMTPVLEGWKRLALTQDLDLLRPGRTIADLRDIRLAEATRGPLDRAYHAADVRAPSATTGRYHPRHVAHWLHVTEMFEAAHSEAAYVGNHGDPRESTATPGSDPDWRFAAHPLGRYQPLRADRVGAGDDLVSDRIPAMHFAADPGAYFARDRRFTIEIHGLAAAVAAADREGIEPSLLVARRALLDGAITFDLLDRPTRRSTDAVRIAVCGAPVVAATLLPDVAAAVVRRSVVIRPTSIDAPSSQGPALPATWQGAALLRLEPLTGSVAFFAGATLAITGGTLAAGRGHASIEPTLVRRGQLQGAVVVEIPAMWVTGTRWLYLGADGTLGEVQTAGAGAPTVPLQGDAATPGVFRMDRRRLVATGPGPAWPPLPLTADGERTPWIIPAGRGAVLMHGGKLVAESAGATTPAPANARASIVFLGAVTTTSTTYQPIAELVVASPTAGDIGRWNILDESGAAAADPHGRTAALAAWVDAQGEDAVRLVARLESDTANVILTPGEVAWTGAAGHSLLVHLPELVASLTTPAGWPRARCSAPMEIAVDGSTWESEGRVARLATGGARGSGTWRGVAPLAAPVMHRRRRVRWASLCPWRNEVPGGPKLDADRTGFLDIDVEHGLFALAKTEPAQLAPPRSPRRAPNVTVTYQEGATRHVGARPAERAPVLGRIPDRPTRIVSRTGAIGPGDVAERLAVPRYLSLTAALQAIAADTARAAVEVIEIADSATYPAEAPVWPASAPGEAVTRELVIRAAEGARPVLTVTAWTAETDAAFERIVLHGLVLSTVAVLPQDPPPEVVLAPPLRDPQSATGDRSRAELDIELCTFVEKVVVRVTTPAAGLRVRVLRAITGALQLVGTGDLVVDASIVDPGAPAATAIRADDGEVTVDRCTVLGLTTVKVLEASESIFAADVTVTDRFHGCIRFSRATARSILPRRHRVLPEPALETGGAAAEVQVRFVSVDRHDAAYARLAESCDPRIRFGAADGAEMGAHHDDLWSVRREALLRRLTEHTPAGLVTGLIRMD